MYIILTGILFCLNLLLFPYLLFPQSSFPKKYRAQLTDKNYSPYSINNPSDFLSQRAIDRRSRQGIAIKENDMPVSPAYLDSFNVINIKVMNKSKWFNAITVLINDSNDLNKLMSLSFVKNFQTVSKMKRELPSDYIDSNNNQQLRLKENDTDYGASFNQISMLKGEMLHQSGYKGEGMLIAILDAGFYKVDSLAPFDSIRINNQILDTYDFVDGHKSVFEDNTHGMSVLSTIGGNLTGQLIGTAPKANFILLRSENAGSELIIEEDNWVAAIEYADSSGADVVNSSLGYSTFDDTLMNHSYQDMDGNTTRVTIAADIAAGKGMLIVNSAGNEGSSTWKHITAPSDGDSVLAVGAVDENSNYASFSSTGPSSDGRIKPNVAAQGLAAALSNSNGEITTGSGTSFSSPITAGLATCLWQANPTKTNMQIIAAIEKSAHQFNTPDEYLGYGIPNFELANNILKDKITSGYPDDKIIDLSPVPFHENLVLKFYSKNSQTITIKLHDITGKIVFQGEVKMDANSYNEINIYAFQAIGRGVYLFNVVSKQGNETKKIVKG